MNKSIKRGISKLLLLTMIVPIISSLFTFESKALGMTTTTDWSSVKINGVEFKKMAHKDDISDGISSSAEMLNGSGEYKNYNITWQDGNEKILNMVPYMQYTSKVTLSNSKDNTIAAKKDINFNAIVFYPQTGSSNVVLGSTTETITSAPEDAMIMFLSIGENSTTVSYFAVVDSIFLEDIGSIMENKGKYVDASKNELIYTESRWSVSNTIYDTIEFTGEANIAGKSGDSGEFNMEQMYGSYALTSIISFGEHMSGYIDDTAKLNSVLKLVSSGNSNTSLTVKVIKRDGTEEIVNSNKTIGGTKVSDKTTVIMNDIQWLTNVQEALNKPINQVSDKNAAITRINAIEFSEPYNALATAIYYKLSKDAEFNQALEDTEGAAPPTEEDLEGVLGGLEKGESLEAWMLTINNFFNSGKTKIEEVNSLGLSKEEADKFGYIDLANYGYEYITDEYRNASTDWNQKENEVKGKISHIPTDVKDNYRLTPFDDYLLRVYFNVQAQYRVPQKPEVKELIDKANDSSPTGTVRLLKKFSLENSWGADLVNPGTNAIGDPTYFYKGMTVSNTSPDTGMDVSSAQNAAGLAANSMKAITDNIDSPNVRVLSQNFGEVMKYLAYGIITEDSAQNYGDGTNNSTGTVPYNENIPKIIPTLEFDYNSAPALTDDTEIMRSSVDFSKFGLPELKNIGRITNNDFSKKKMSQMYLSLMYIKKYASVDKEINTDGKVVVKNTESVFSGLSVIDPKAGQEYTTIGRSDLVNKKMQALIDADNGKTEDEKKKSTIEKSLGVQIRSYIQIYEGLEYIGTLEDKWLSPELLKICDYYKDILVYKDIVSTSTYNPTELAETQPFAEFFSLEAADGSTSGIIGDRIQKGIAASATYLPLVTNTFDYDAISVIDDDKFVEEFHYKFGFHRKALFIDTNSSAAMQAYVAGQKDTLKVATLADMLQSEKDIVLYVDPGMYNVRTIAEKQNLSYSKLQNTEEAGKEDNGFFGNIADSWSEWRNLDAAAICKTSGNNLYSSALTKIKPFGMDEGQVQGFSKDHYVLSTVGINEYYDQDEYTDIQGFAFVSGIYRCARLLTICQQQSANPKPVFVSSPTLFNVTGISKKEFNCVYNYLMVKNLKANLGLDYKTELDLDSPLFIDVYGNITTQSGLVVIPAASNASLYEADKYSIITAGLISLANNPDAYHLPIGNENIDKYIDDGFKKNLETGYWEMQNKTTDNVMFSFSNLPLQSAGIRKSLYKEALAVCGEGINGVNTVKPRVNLIMEVMRGAPIENINFDDEGLSGFRNIDKTGIYIAYRIEQLGDVLLSSSEGNSLLKMPNLAFMKGIEYVVVFVFKILLAAGVFILMIKLYADGMSNNLGIKTGLEFMLAIFSIIVSIVLLPTLINFSYYQTNKQLLQKEAAYLMILNTEKNAEGKEVGIKEIREPSSTTRFYVKMEEIKVPWWDVISDVYSSKMFTNMKEVYEESYSSSIYSTFPGAIMRGNGVYVPIEDLFKSSEIRFKAYSENTSVTSDNELPGVIYQAVKPNSKMSYVLPYYAIIDKLLTDATNYNDDYKTMAYRTKILQNGNVRTVGLLDAYFKSNRFLGPEERNLFGLFDIYSVPYSTDSRKPIWSEDELTTMSRSLWYNKDAFTEEEVEYKLNQLDQLGKEFIVSNRTLLNKVTDETFIKVFALYMSVKHNELFKVPAARGIELMDIDTKDIIRLSLASKSDVMHSISMSFGRFTYTQAGTFGTILMAFLLLIYYLTSLIRPAVMLILVGCLIFSYVYKKVMRYEQNHSLEGYIVSCALICMVNIIYAVVIKISVSLPEFGVDPTFSIIGQIFLQVVYTVLLGLIGLIVLKNPKDLGFFTYKTFYDAHMSNKMSAVKMSVNKLMANSVLAPFSYTTNNMRNEYLGTKRTAGLTGDDIYNNMLASDEQREQDVFNNHHTGR